MPIVLNQAKREVLIYDDIGWDVTARGIVEELRAFDGKDITVRINSPGGSVFDGIAIYNAMKNYEGTVSVFIDGIALSMASGIAMAGDTVEMADNALMMIHDPSAFVVGTEDDMASALQMLKASKQALTKAYVDKTGLDTDEVSQLMSAETWMTAEEAEEKGFADSIGGEVRIAASFSMPDSLKVPAAMVGPLANAIFSNPSDPKTEQPKMADKPQDHTPQPATLDQLLNLAGADNDFAVEQLKIGATLEQALNALNAHLMKRSDDAVTAQKAAEDAAKAAADAAAESAKKKKTPGQDPVSNDGADDDGFGDDPLATFNKLMADQREKGVPSLTAYRNVHRQNPGLIESLREKATA
jgi:ATP-dependent Clp endopeptidase proteolytic subunit ClpP